MQLNFQVLETDSIEKIYQWISSWFEFMEFEIKPVLSSDEVKKRAISLSIISRCPKLSLKLYKFKKTNTLL